MELSPYIFFKGNAREAFEFYKSVFGGELDMQTLGESPEEVRKSMGIDESRNNEIMNAVLKADGFTIRGCDGNNASPETKKVELCLTGDDEEKLTQWFNGLSQEGNVRMKLAPMFWGDKFGSLTDKFGVDWVVDIRPKG